MITAAPPAHEIAPAARARIAERACRWLIRAAMMAGDSATLGRLAHAVSGVAGNFAAEEIVASARWIEVMAGSGDLAGAGVAEVALGRAIDRFRVAALAMRVGRV
jgi:Hpt domain